MNTRELINKIWDVINSVDDSDEVVTLVCGLLNETEAKLNNKEIK
jgi:hypothetical protein